MNTGRPDRHVPLRRLVPNVLTTVALCSGLAAVHFALKETPDWNRALTAIGIAAVFDVLDGRAARLLRATSRFGAVLDSLSDFLSFGVAPALLLYQWELKGTDVFGLAALVTYVLCAALRLARFTSMPRTPERRTPLAAFFVGLPSPAAAGAVLIPLMVNASKTSDFKAPEWVVVPWTIAVGLMMISRIPMYSIKRIRVKRRMVPLLLVVAGLGVVMAARDTWLAVSIAAFAYLLTAPLSVAHHQRARLRIDADAARVGA
jgi:CDP-diacylglycerol--serine O-phosphatidyltransferase